MTSAEVLQITKNCEWMGKSPENLYPSPPAQHKTAHMLPRDIFYNVWLPIVSSAVDKSVARPNSNYLDSARPLNVQCVIFLFPRSSANLRHVSHIAAFSQPHMNDSIVFQAIGPAIVQWYTEYV